MLINITTVKTAKTTRGNNANLFERQLNGLTHQKPPIETESFNIFIPHPKLKITTSKVKQKISVCKHVHF